MASETSEPVPCACTCFSTVQLPQEDSYSKLRSLEAAHRSRTHSYFLFPTLRLAAHHVRPAVSTPSTGGHALCASFARKPTSHSCRAQLFRHLQSELVWSPRSSLKVISNTLCINMPTTDCLQAAWPAVVTTPMVPRPDKKLCRHHRQGA